MHGKHRFAIDEKGWNQIKELERMGFTGQKIAEITGWSSGAVYMWHGFPTWNDYCRYKQEQVRKYTESKRQRQNPLSETREEVVSVQQTHLPLKSLSTETEQTLIGVLSQISNEIHLLRLAWERTPEKPETKLPQSWVEKKFGVKI